MGNGEPSWASVLLDGAVDGPLIQKLDENEKATKIAWESQGMVVSCGC